MNAATTPVTVYLFTCSACTATCYPLPLFLFDTATERDTAADQHTQRCDGTLQPTNDTWAIY